MFYHFNITFKAIKAISAMDLSSISNLGNSFLFLFFHSGNKIECGLELYRINRMDFLNLVFFAVYIFLYNQMLFNNFIFHIYIL